MYIICECCNANNYMSDIDEEEVCVECSQPLPDMSDLECVDDPAEVLLEDTTP